MTRSRTAFATYVALTYLAFVALLVTLLLNHLRLQVLHTRQGREQAQLRHLLLAGSRLAATSKPSTQPAPILLPPDPDLDPAATLQLDPDPDTGRVTVRAALPHASQSQSLRLSADRSRPAELLPSTD